MPGRSRVHRRAWMMSGAFDPEDLDVWALYMLSPDITGADGSTSDAWGGAAWSNRKGVGGSAGQATAAKRPVLRKSGANISPNGTQMVEFDGANDELTGTLPGGGLGNTEGYTLFAYLKMTTVADAQGQLAFVSSGVELASQSHSFNGYNADFQYGANGHSAGTATESAVFGAAATGYQVLTLRFNPPPTNVAAAGKMQMWKNGVELTSNPVNRRWNIDMATGYVLGGNSTGNGSLAGSLGAFFLAVDALDDTLRADTENFILDYFEG